MKQEEYFTQLVRENKSTIYTVCYMFSKAEEEVTDLFQETLINMWKGIDSFREESKILTMDVNFFEDDDANAAQVRMLHQRIGRLGLVDRALVMMWLEGMSYDEIGTVMGITAKNVGVKLFRIKEQLKKL